jgi:N-formylglutamate amidohydrolase
VLATALAAPLVASTASRLRVDLNRSVGHPRLHSEVARNAPPDAYVGIELEVNHQHVIRAGRHCTARWAQELGRLLSSCFTIVEIEYTAKPFAAMSWLIG